MARKHSERARSGHTLIRFRKFRRVITVRRVAKTLREAVTMRSLLWPLSALLAPSLIAAQSDSLRSASATCWRGKPAPQCRTFWLTEISGEYAFVSTTAHYRQVYTNPSGTFVSSYDKPDVSSRLVWTVGPMFNTSPRHAFGGT